MNVEHDLHKFAVGRYLWSRDELLALPVSVQTQHLTWLQEHLQELAKQMEPGG